MKRETQKDAVSADQLGLIFQRTEEALKAQGKVPISPGIVVGNSTVMCAGAMLVHQALGVLRSQREADEFANKVTQESGTFIEDVGTMVGLDRNMVMMTKRLNDRQTAQARLPQMRQYFVGLRQQAVAAA